MILGSFAAPFVSAGADEPKMASHSGDHKAAAEFACLRYSNVVNGPFEWVYQLHLNITPELAVTLAILDS